MPSDRPFNPLMSILQARGRTTRHVIASVRRESKLKVAVVSTSAIFLWLLIFVFALVGFFIFETIGREVLGVGDLTVGDIVMARLLSVFALALFVMLIFSNILTTFGTLYRSREVPPQILAPVPTSTFFLGRFYDIVSMSSWASAFLGTPIMLAYGLTAKAPLIFYPMLIAFFVPYVVIPAAIGSIISMVLVRFFANVPRGPVAGVGLGIAVALFGFFRGRLVAPNFSDTSTAQAILDAMGRTQSPFLPSYWLSQGVLGAATGDLRATFVDFFLLVVNAAFFLFLATEVAERLYYPGYSALQGGNVRKKEGSGLLGRFDVFFNVLPEPTRALVVKDFKVFWRDPTQWTQFVLFFGIMALYIANLGGARSFTSRWSEWATILNVAACLLILASLTTRFVFPMVSLEGPRIWILGLAPVGMRRIMRQKFLTSVAMTAFFTVTLVILSAIRLDLDRAAFLISVVAIAASTVALSGLSVGLGSLYPNFREDNPSRVVSGMGGTLNFILSMVYVVLVTVALAQVMLWKPSWTGIWSDRTTVVAVVATFIVALTALTSWVPMRLGRRNLERVEF